MFDIHNFTKKLKLIGDKPSSTARNNLLWNAMSCKYSPLSFIILSELVEFTVTKSGHLLCDFISKGHCCCKAHLSTHIYNPLSLSVLGQHIKVWWVVDGGLHSILLVPIYRVVSTTTLVPLRMQRIWYFTSGLNTACDSSVLTRYWTL